MPERRPPWRDAAALVVLGLVLVTGVRGVLIELLWLTPHHREFPSPPTLLATLRLAGWGVLANVGWQLARARGGPPARLVAAVVVLGVCGAFTAVRHAAFSAEGAVFRWSFTADRAVGSFPFPGGSEQTFHVLGVPTVAHIDPSGLRTCGHPAPASPTVNVATIGDSFVFGKGVADEATLCAHLQARLEQASPGTYRVLNAGQAGANLRSYGDTLRFVVDAHEVDVVTVALLIPDDAQILDVNQTRWLVRQPWFQWPAAFLDPRALVDGLPVLLGDHTSDLAVQAVLETGLDALVASAAAADVPVFVYLYGEGRLSLDHYEQHLRDRAVDVPGLRVIGTLVPPAELTSSIEGDGHPTTGGNAWYAETLASHLLDLQPRATR